MSNYKNIIIYAVTGTNVLPDRTANAILQASDWTQIPDNGLTADCVAEFKTYRAAIRTIRKTNPASPTWPDAPNEVDA